MEVPAGFIRAIQPGLRANRTLKELNLENCSIDEEGLRLVVDALVGNTTIEVLLLIGHEIPSNIASFVEFTRLVEFTQLKCLRATALVMPHGDLHSYDAIGMDVIKNFISGVLHQNTIIEHFELGLYDWREVSPHREVTLAMRAISERNVILNQANALLAPRQPRTGVPIASKSGIWSVALAKMGRHKTGTTRDESLHEARYHPGVSAIFKIFQARPAILEYQRPRTLPGPTVASAIQRREGDDADSTTKRRRTLCCKK
jgi:hypothetical protein